jgi:DNA ligase-1
VRRFARLIEALDRTTRTREKVSALEGYFREAPPEDAIWTLWVLAGRKQRRVLSGGDLRAWAAEFAELPEWLVEESYSVVGDLAETLALLVGSDGAGEGEPLHRVIEEDVLGLAVLSTEEQRARVRSRWRDLSFWEAFVWHKLLTGAFRVGVGRGLVLRGLEGATGIDRAVLAHRIAGSWEPTPETWARIVGPEGEADDRARPYPFFLAHPLEDEPSSLGGIHAWQVEWKWDGIRGQLLRRGDTVAIWSRGEELVTTTFPEVAEAAGALPDGTVLDGELVAIDTSSEGGIEGAPAVLPFSELQRRLNRSSVGAKLLREVPVRFLAYDLLEERGEDTRGWPTVDRRAALEGLLNDGDPVVRGGIELAPLLRPESWEEAAAARARSRGLGVEGLMLKARDAEYGVGRPRGAWWKWKVEPLRLDVVMVYAQAGRGRRANLYTDYTFAVWDEEELVPIAKAYSGLDDAEIREVDRWIRRNTIERFGPVRSVEQELVFELAFDSIRRSPRHKSGIALRFPRIARWRRDKPAAEADTLDRAEALLRVVPGPPERPAPRVEELSLFGDEVTDHDVTGGEG